jgi:hypothetical protein
MNRRTSLWASALAAAFAVAPTPAHGQTVYTFRQGLDGYTGAVDTHIRASAPDEGNGASESLVWNTDDPTGSTLDTFALLRFDDIFGAGPGQIPPGSVITSATLRYHLFDGASVGALHEVTTDWAGTTTFNTFGATPGVQSTDYDTSTIASPPGTGAAQSLNVTETLVAWSDDPTSNRGWLFRPSNRFTSGFMRSSDYLADPALRPTLTVVVNDTGAPILVRPPYLQSATGESITVAWRTDMPVDSVVNYGLASNMLTSTVSIAGATRDHFIPLAGLAAGTTYYYEIAWSGGPIVGADMDHVFTTPPAENTSPITVWALGDSGRATVTQTAVRDAMLAANGDEAPDLIIHAGDIAYVNGADGEYTSTFFTRYDTVLRKSVFWPSHGNHDNLSADSIAQTGPYYKGFALPTGASTRGVASGTEAYYSFDVGGAHFISLDSAGLPLTPGSPMLLWLADDLAASTDADWIIAFFHHAPYSNGTHDSNTDTRMTMMRENAISILENGGVDLVVGGHSHGYERSYLVDGAYETPSIATGKILDAGDGDPAGDGPYTKPLGITPHAGAVYVVAGHALGGSGVGPHPLMATGENAAGSCLITIDGQMLTLRNVRSDGAITDTVAISKLVICPADLDGDDLVGGADLAALLADWGASGASSDLNGDGVVDGADLAALLASWGGCQ